VRLVVLLACVTGVAHADTNAARAAALFEEGKDLAHHANYAAACERFAQSYELDPAAGTALNFADCQEHLGNLRVAYELFERAASGSDKRDNPVRAQYARDRAAALAPRLGTLVVKIAGAVDRLKLTIGGREVSAAAEVHEYVEPGDVEIVVAAPERRYVTRAHASAKQTTVVEVPALGAAAPAVAPRRHSWVVAAVAMGGVGALALAGSGVLALSAERYYSDAFTKGQCFSTPSGDQCTQAGLQTVATAHSRADAATALFIGGAVLAAAGVTTYVMAPRDGVEVAPAIAPHAAGVTLIGRF
jgi:hypothetical protein